MKAAGTNRKKLKAKKRKCNKGVSNFTTQEEETAIQRRVAVFIRGYLSGGQNCVFIQAEDSVGHNDLVGQKAAAHHLQGETQSTEG